jgi:hypothetical protein
MGATSGAVTAYPSGISEFTSVFSGFYSILSFMCNVSQIVVCTFSFGHYVVCPSSIYGF